MKIHSEDGVDRIVRERNLKEAELQSDFITRKPGFLTRMFRPRFAKARQEDLATEFRLQKQELLLNYAHKIAAERQRLQESWDEGKVFKHIRVWVNDWYTPRDVWYTPKEVILRAKICFCPICDRRFSQVMFLAGRQIGETVDSAPSYVEEGNGNVDIIMMPVNRINNDQEVMDFLKGIGLNVRVRV